jgi:hypothetical protein
MKLRIVFWDVLQCKITAECLIPDDGAARTSETSVDNYFIRQYIPEDNSEQHLIFNTGYFLMFVCISLLMFWLPELICSVHVT